MQKQNNLVKTNASSTWGRKKGNGLTIFFLFILFIDRHLALIFYYFFLYTVFVCKFRPQESQSDVLGDLLRMISLVVGPYFFDMPPLLLPGLEPATPGTPTVLTRVRCLSLKPDMDREVRSHPDSRISAKVQSWELGLSRVLRPDDHRNHPELRHVSSLHYRLRHQSCHCATSPVLLDYICPRKTPSDFRCVLADRRGKGLVGVTAAWRCVPERFIPWTMRLLEDASRGCIVQRTYDSKKDAATVRDASKWHSVCEIVNIVQYCTEVYSESGERGQVVFSAYVGWFTGVVVGGDWHALIKKEKQIFLIYKEIQNGAVAKLYMTNGLLIYDIFAHFLIY